MEIDTTPEVIPFSPHMSNGGQNKDQSFQDSVVKTIPSLSSSTESDLIVYLKEYGLKLGENWLESCISELKRSVQGFENFNVRQKGDTIICRYFDCGGGVLPSEIEKMHDIDLAGPFILQVDAIYDATHIFTDATPERCLKLYMSDRLNRRIIGLEYSPINLKVPAPAGLKVIIRNVNVWHGLLTLEPKVFSVLGGMEEALVDIPKRRLLQGVPPLSLKATACIDDGAIADNSTTFQDSSPSKSSTQGTPEFPNRASNVESTSRVVAEYNEFNTVDATVAMSEMDISEKGFAGPSRKANTGCNPSYYTVFTVGKIPIDNSRRNADIPLAYLANLWLDWIKKKDSTTSIQRYVKCVISGIYLFEFENVAQYKLVVYADDGSLRSEVCIHHKVVESYIGSLSSLTKKEYGEMMKTVEAFETTLCYFKGTLLVEMNKDSTIPVALEMMNEGSAFNISWLQRNLKLISYDELHLYDTSD